MLLSRSARKCLFLRVLPVWSAGACFCFCFAENSKAGDVHLSSERWKYPAPGLNLSMSSGGSGDFWMETSVEVAAHKALFTTGSCGAMERTGRVSLMTSGLLFIQLCYWKNSCLGIREPFWVHSWEKMTEKGCFKTIFFSVAVSIQVSYK